VKTTVKPVLINHADFAAMAGVPKTTLLRWTRQGLGGCPKPVRAVERTYLFNRRDVLKWCRIPDTDAA
jgi:hypothetical protein